MAVKTSEFWNAVDAVFGQTLGRSLVADLYLPSIGGTAEEGIDRGVAPVDIWHALVDETQVGEEARWVHRMDAKERRQRFS